MALKDITVTARDGRVSQLEQVYIRGSMVSLFEARSAESGAGPHLVDARVGARRRRAQHRALCGLCGQGCRRRARSTESVVGSTP